MSKIINKKQFEVLSKGKVVIDNDFKPNAENNTTGQASYSGLCVFCDELIKLESQRVALKVSPTRQKVAHKNCLEAYVRDHGEINV